MTVDVCRTTQQFYNGGVYTFAWSRAAAGGVWFLIGVEWHEGKRR